MELHVLIGTRLLPIFSVLNMIWVYFKLVRKSLLSETIKITPGRFGRGEVIYLLLLFFWRFLLQSIGLRKKLQPKQNGSSGYLIDGPANKIEMPLQTDLRPAVEQYLAAIRASSGQVLADEQYPFFFCAVTTPALLVLLAQTTCPVQPLGTVNVRNTFRLLDMQACRTLVSEHTEGVQKATILARLEPVARKVKRGWEMDFVIDIVAFSEGKGKGTSIFSQTFSFLQFHRHREPPVQPTLTVGDTASMPEPTATASLSFEPADTLRWAKVTKDYNPIHISWVAARLFGQSSRIAHGNHVAARALAQFANQGRSVTDGKAIQEVQVAFKRPVRVPSTMQVVSRQGAEKRSVSVERAGKVLVEIVVQ